MLAVANALDTMFLRRQRPVYTTSKDFPRIFTETIKRYAGAGAGMPIRLNHAGDAVYPFEVLNKGGSYNTSTVAPERLPTSAGSRIGSFRGACSRAASPPYRMRTKLTPCGEH